MDINKIIKENKKNKIKTQVAAWQSTRPVLWGWGGLVRRDQRLCATWHCPGTGRVPGQAATQ